MADTREKEAGVEEERVLFLLCPSLPFMSFGIEGPDGDRVTLQFEHGRLAIRGPMIDAFMAAYEHPKAALLRGRIHLSTPEEMAAFAKAQEWQQMGGAARGMFSSAHAQQMQTAKIRSGAEGLAQQTSATELAKFASAVESKPADGSGIKLSAGSPSTKGSSGGTN